MTVAAIIPRQRLALSWAAAIILVGVAGFALSDKSDLADPLTYVLAALSVVAWLLSARWTGNTVISPASIPPMVAVGLLDPAAAFVVPLLGELGGWLIQRYRWQAMTINVASGATPTLLVALGFTAVGPTESTPAFWAALAVATAVMLALNTIVAVPLINLLDGRRPILPQVADELELLPTMGITAALVVVVAEAEVHWGYWALALAAFVLVMVSYVDRLIGRARDQTRQYANLSWGVLSSLVRTLNERDHRAARHCAAVAMFSRDIAELCGFDEHDQELAHTAGLLHDIGKFTLSDRVMERGAQLDESDWRGIRRHPDIGADLLKDIGVFGPVGEIVRCHHERLDGRGYPRGLTADEIPEVAKIVAVAEVYDTLTAPDTYRTPMNSFEALNELRRVSGSQLEARYVDALAKLLAGRGTDYRHQDEADFDRELDMERRMSEAATPA